MLGPADPSRPPAPSVEVAIRAMVDELRAGYGRLPASSDLRRRGTEHIQRALEMLRSQHYGAAQIELNRAAVLLREPAPAAPAPAAPRPRGS